MSKHLKIFLVLVAAPFLIFWGAQLGIAAAGNLFQEPAARINWWPGHFAWYGASAALGAWALLGGLMEMLADRIFCRKPK